MDWLIGVDWEKAFVPNTALLEIFVRGTLTYLAIFLILRIVPKRQRGAAGFADLLVIVLVADAAQNAMADDYELNRGNMKREAMTDDELLSELRLHGVDDPKEVRSMNIESSGRISVITYEKASG